MNRFLLRLSVIALAASFDGALAAAVVRPRQVACSAFGGAVGNANGGIQSLSTYNTIVALGDSWTDGGRHNGSSLDPAVIIPPDPRAGGRLSNGPLWVEYLADDADATLNDFARAGSVTNAGSFSGSGASAPDINDQLNAIAAAPELRPFDRDTTLFTLFVGIEDFIYSNNFTSPTAQTVSGNIAYQLLRLSSSPTYAKNVVVLDNYALGYTQTSRGTQYQQSVFDGLATLRRRYGLNVAYVNLAPLWSDILQSPTSYGFETTVPCLQDPETTVGACEQPDSTLYWMPQNPTTAGHKLIADYVADVITQCSYRG